VFIRNFRVVQCVVGLAIIGACSNADLIRDVERAQVSGDEFSRQLHSEYVALAKTEEAEGDHRDSKHFALKAKTAAQGKPVVADDWHWRDIRGTSDEAELKAARGELNEALESGAGTRSPKAAARAQRMYECWIQEAEEDSQPWDINQCRDGFKLAMAEIGPPPQEEQKAMVAAPASKELTVYFKFDSDELVEDSRKELSEIMKNVEGNKPEAVQITAYTDLVGTEAYNKKLSERRAEKIEQLLKGAGVSSVSTSAMGQSNPVVDTKKANQLNRRAVISYQQ
jgi:OOP family OmpA-OmpF porin